MQGCTCRVQVGCNKSREAEEEIWLTSSWFTRDLHDASQYCAGINKRRCGGSDGRGRGQRQEIAGFMLERFPFDGDVVGGLELGRIQGEEEPWERRVGGRGDQEFRTLGEYVPSYVADRGNLRRVRDGFLVSHCKLWRAELSTVEYAVHKSYLTRREMVMAVRIFPSSASFRFAACNWQMRQGRA
ncbi:hypothetical protein CABS01_01658 [Colletotrichum abscissum]|uniref:uncharacterized protein n=1 Tax=Colletotrichum abscissum TaxID=1671311 RepID=UPI0027D662E4|nr:uncharacterized protein CABS01_01658 [Colletotrichum abscissum]KAK1495851.1 hypothetical protein CABS01_01658 [Colletotrichum abscissum]